MRQHAVAYSRLGLTIKYIQPCQLHWVSTFSCTELRLDGTGQPTGGVSHSTWMRKVVTPRLEWTPEGIFEHNLLCVVLPVLADTGYSVVNSHSNTGGNCRAPIVVDL